jgi:HEAT repeat protein
MKLGNVGDADPAAADALTEALGDTDIQVRRAAVFAVVKLKKPSEAIVAQLDAMSRADSDSGIRDVAARAVKRLGQTD